MKVTSKRADLNDIKLHKKQYNQQEGWRTIGSPERVSLTTPRMMSGLSNSMCKVRSLRQGSGFPSVFLRALGFHRGAPGLPWVGASV